MKLLILSSSELRGRPLRLLERELGKNGLGRSDWRIYHVDERLLQELRMAENLPMLLLGKAPTIAVLNVRNFGAARGFIWTFPEIPEAKLLAARRKAGVVPSPRKRKDPTEEDRKALEILEAKAALAGRKVIPTLEPEEAIRNDTQYCLFRIDIARACRLALGGIAITEESGPFEVGGPECLNLLGPIVSVDIETTARDPLEAQIKCIGFDDGERVVILGPWTNAWSKDVGEFLGTREQVIFHNGPQYDLICMRKHGIVWA